MIHVNNSRHLRQSVRKGLKVRSLRGLRVKVSWRSGACLEKLANPKHSSMSFERVIGTVHYDSRAREPYQSLEATDSMATSQL